MFFEDNNAIFFEDNDAAFFEDNDTTGYDLTFFGAVLLLTKTKFITF
jgi:hypothetical protein